MNPYVTQLMAAEKIRDMQADAAAARRARQAGSGRKPARVGETGRLRALLARRPARQVAA